MQTLISINLHAKFGFLKKPDINEGIYLTYNMIHKPALLGIFGAIAGLNGYNIEGAMQPDDIPEFRQRLKDLMIAITPLESMNGNFGKQIIKYTNTVGYASEEQGGVLIIDEQTLINPNYQVFLLLDIENELHSLLYERLKNQEAEFIPYLGKNDHQIWWDNFQEWEWKKFQPDSNFRIDTLYEKPSDKKLKRDTKRAGLGGRSFGSYIYFERLPKDWHSQLPHYQLQEFVLTDFPLSPGNDIENLFEIENGTGKKIIQIF